MKRRMLGNVNNIESLKKDNFGFIFAMVLVLMVWLIMPYLAFKIYDNNLEAVCIQVVTYSIFGLTLAHYISYILYFIFCKDQLKIRNKLIKFVLFLFYTTFMQIYLLIFTKNMYIITITNISYLILYFVYPYLKYFKQNTYEQYNENLTKSREGDYALTIFSFIILIVTIIDNLEFKNQNLLSLLYNVPIVISLLAYLFIVLTVFPKYSSMLWMNLYYRKYAVEKDKIYTEEWAFFKEDRTKIKDVKFTNDNIEIIYEDGLIAVFDPIWTEMCFYDLVNEKLSLGYTVINIEKNLLRKIKYDLHFQDGIRTVTLFISKYTNQVLKVEAGKKIFEPNYHQVIFEGIINTFLFIGLFLASNNVYLGMILLFIQYALILRLTYLRKWQRYLIKLFVLCFYLVIILYLCLNTSFMVFE